MRRASLLFVAVLSTSCSAGGVTAGTSSTPTPVSSGTPTPGPTPTSTPLSGCITHPAVGDAVIPCASLSYDVHVPAGCLIGCGLVLDVHGLAENGAMEDANTGMRALGDQYGYVVIQPNAAGTPPATAWNAVPDYDLVFAFLQEAITAYAIDPNRVHMTGFSMGGTMTFDFVCAHADVLASVAAGSAHLISCSFSGAQTPSRQLPILQMHGTKDPLVNFTLIGLTQRNDILTGWSMGPGAVVGTGAGFVRTRYSNAQGTVYEFLQHDYASTQVLLQGHCYPGSSDPGGAPGQLFSFACAPPDGFDWGSEAMKFFLAHPRG